MAKKTYSRVKGSGKEPRVPTTMAQVRALLSGRHSDDVREPLTQREERKYKKVWKRRGKGLTKPKYASKETKARKERQSKLSKSWAKKKKKGKK